MVTQMHVRNQIGASRDIYRDAREAALHDELVTATERGERDRCPECGQISVAYSFEQTPDGEIFLAQCETCGMIGS